MNALSKHCIALPRPVEERDSPFILSDLIAYCRLNASSRTNDEIAVCLPVTVVNWWDKNHCLFET